MADKIIATEKDQTISNLIASQGDFPDISVVEKQQNLFGLPKDCEPLYSKYDFRWISKDTRMIERNLIKGWRICTRMLCSWLPEHNFSVNGAVEKYSHILGFRPKELSKAYRDKYQGQSVDNIKAARKDGERDKKDSSFYTAKLSSAEEKDGKVPGELVQGEDF